MDGGDNDMQMREIIDIVTEATAGPGSIRAWHGSTEDFVTPDLSRSGTGATAEYGSPFASPGALPRAFYLVSERHNAEPYGDPMQFEINGSIKRYDGKRELEKWAKDNGYGSAQQMLDDYYDGDLYAAYDLDHALLDKLDEAQAEGYAGIAVDFGDLKIGNAGRKRTAGTYYVVSDPSALKRVTS
jgi:hypothetical protein